MSVEFSTRKGLTEAWRKVRGDLLEAHGLARDAKRVTVRSGSIVMDLWVADQWMLYTDDRSTMCERLDADRDSDVTNRYRLRRRGES